MATLVPHTPSLGELLGQSIGQGVQQGVQYNLQSLQKEAAQQSALAKALLTQQTKSLYPSSRDVYSGSKIVADLVKKSMGQNPDQEALTRGEDILAKSSEFLGQGQPPLKAYASAVNHINKVKQTRGELDKISDQSDWFGKEEKQTKDKAIIKNVKKSGLYTDDQLALELIHKGYGYKDLTKFGLKLSPEFSKAMGEETTAKTGTKKMTQADITRFMEAADNDPDKAVELAKKEGFDTEVK